MRFFHAVQEDAALGWINAHAEEVVNADLRVVDYCRDMQLDLIRSIAATAAQDCPALANGFRDRRRVLEMPAGSQKRRILDRVATC
jgi:hypothetical protein